MFKYSKFFSILLCFSLVLTSMPLVSAHEFLAVPGESQLSTVFSLHPWDDEAEEQGGNAQTYNFVDDAEVKSADKNVSAAAFIPGLALPGLSLENKARLSFIPEEGIFSVLLLNVVPSLLVFIGLIEPDNAVFVRLGLYFWSNYFYGTSHSTLYKWDEDGAVVEAGAATAKDKLRFRRMGYLFRAGYLIPWIGHIAGPVFAVLSHAVYSNIIAPRYKLYAAMSKKKKKKKKIKLRIRRTTAQTGQIVTRHTDKPYRDIYSWALYMISAKSDKDLRTIANDFVKLVEKDDYIRKTVLDMSRRFISKIKGSLEFIGRDIEFKRQLFETLKLYAFAIIKTCRDSIPLSKAILAIEDAMQSDKENKDLPELYSELYKELNKLPLEDFYLACNEILDQKPLHKEIARKLARSYREINNHDKALQVLDDFINAAGKKRPAENIDEFVSMRESIQKAKEVLEGELHPNKRFKTINNVRVIEKFAAPDGKGGYFVDTLGFPGQWDVAVNTEDHVLNAPLLRFLKSLSVIDEEIQDGSLKPGLNEQFQNKTIILNSVTVIDSEQPLQVSGSHKGNSVYLDVTVSRDFLYKQYSDKGVKYEIDTQREFIRAAIREDRINTEDADKKQDTAKFAYPEAKPAVALISQNIMTDISIDVLEDCLNRRGIDNVAGRKFRNKDLLSVFVKELSSAEELDKKSPNIIGISVNIFNIEEANTLIKKIRREIPDAFIVIGGACSQTPEQMASLIDDFDFMIRGEADEILPELALTIGDSKRSEGLSRNQISRIKQDPVFQTGMMSKLDTEVIIRDLAYTNMVEEFHLPKPKKKLWAHSWETERGCVHNCNFCTIIKGRGVRYVSAEEMKNWLIDRLLLNFGGAMDHDALEELLLHAKSTGEISEIPGLSEKIEIFFFDDDPLIGEAGRERMIEFCDMVKDRGLENYFDFRIRGTNVNSLYRNNKIDKQLIQKLKQGGFNEIYLGTDGYSQAVIDQNNKGYSFEKRVIPLNKYLREEGFAVFNNAVVSTPYTTARQLLEEYIIFMTYIIFPVPGLTPNIVAQQATTFTNREIVNNTGIYVFSDSEGDDHGHYRNQRNHRVPKQFWEYSLIDYQYIPYADPNLDDLLPPQGTYFFPQKFKEVFKEKDYWKIVESWSSMDEEEHPELTALARILLALQAQRKNFDEALDTVHAYISGVRIYSFSDYLERMESGRLHTEEYRELHRRRKVFNIAMRDRKTDEAIRAYESMIEMHPGFYAAYISMANYLMDHNRVSDSIRIFDQSTRVLEHQNRRNMFVKMLNEHLKIQCKSLDTYQFTTLHAIILYYFIAKLEETVGVENVELLNIQANRPISLQRFDTTLMSITLSDIDSCFDSYGGQIKEYLKNEKKFKLFGLSISSLTSGSKTQITIDLDDDGKNSAKINIDGAHAVNAVRSAQ